MNDLLRITPLFPLLLAAACGHSNATAPDPNTAATNESASAASSNASSSPEHPASISAGKCTALDVLVMAPGQTMKSVPLADGATIHVDLPAMPSWICVKAPNLTPDRCGGDRAPITHDGATMTLGADCKTFAGD